MSLRSGLVQANFLAHASTKFPPTVPQLDADNVLHSFAVLSSLELYYGQDPVLDALRKVAQTDFPNRRDLSPQGKTANKTVETDASAAVELLSPTNAAHLFSIASQSLSHLTIFSLLTRPNIEDGLNKPVAHSEKIGPDVYAMDTKDLPHPGRGGLAVAIDLLKPVETVLDPHPAIQHWSEVLPEYEYVVFWSKLTHSIHSSFGCGSIGGDEAVGSA